MPRKARVDANNRDRMYQELKTRSLRMSYDAIARAGATIVAGEFTAEQAALIEAAMVSQALDYAKAAGDAIAGSRPVVKVEGIQ